MAQKMLKRSPQTHSIKQSPQEIPTKENNQSNNPHKKSPQTHSIKQSPQEIPINLFKQTIPTRNPHKPIQSNNHLKKSP
jgi:hypothetical protein